MADLPAPDLGRHEDAGSDDGAHDDTNTHTHTHTHLNIKPYHFILLTAGWLTFSLRDQVKYGFALNTMFNFTIGKS